MNAKSKDKKNEYRDQEKPFKVRFGTGLLGESNRPHNFPKNALIDISIEVRKPNKKPEKFRGTMKTGIGVVVDNIYFRFKENRPIVTIYPQERNPTNLCLIPGKETKLYLEKELTIIIKIKNWEAPSPKSLPNVIS
jgi:hypothetical protein